MYLLFSLLLSINVFANDQLAYHPKWLRLLHYKKNLSGFLSQADGKGFFLDPEGKHDPVAELKTTIKIFSSESSPNDEHPICKFPLRFKWLSSEVGPWRVDLSGCQKYLAFLSKVAAKRASIVFSSYYLGNPNSAFGHTFLRLSRYEDTYETEMLDYGINYSAQANETNPLLYAYKGLFGGFKGQFTAIPYYYKVREYSDFEFRDLWSYDLKLNMNQVLQIVDHVWELGHTDFDYYYFKENCAYHLLSVLEVALPEKNLTDQYSVFAIPADTIRLLQKENLLKDGRKRESTFSRLSRMSQNFNSDDLGLAKKIANNPSESREWLTHVSDKKASEILDLSIEAFDYYHAEKILADETSIKNKKAPLLVARAINPIVSEENSIAKDYSKDSPALSHSPTRLSVSEGLQNKQGSFSRFEFRAAHHDLLDPPQGSLQDAQLEMFRFSFDYKQQEYREHKVILNELSLLSLKNFPKQNFWASPMSWEFDGGVKQLKRPNCFDCPSGYLNGSVGNAINMFKDRLLLAILMNSEFKIQSYFKNNYLLGAGPKLVSRWFLSEKWVMGIESYLHFNTSLGSETYYEWQIRNHVTQKFSLFGKLNGTKRQSVSQNSAEIGLQYFYE
ncbi:MAG: DUF4105 domain-containing protein [Bacteriovoracaceae bacterium]